MGNPSQDELYPKSLVLPIVTEAIRDTLVADVGSIIYNSNTNKIDICIAKVAAAASWEEVNSA